MKEDPAHIRSIPTQEILEGLARLHPFVLVADREGRIEWMSPKLRSQLYQDPSVANLAAAGSENLFRRFGLTALASAILVSARK